MPLSPAQQYLNKIKRDILTGDDSRSGPVDIDKLSGVIDASKPGPGFLQRTLDLLQTPGYLVQNVLRGRFGAALGNVLDLNPLVLPLHLMGTPIAGMGEVSEEERSNFGDLLKQFGATVPNDFSGDVISFAGDVLTDPLTYLTFGTSTIAKLGGKAGLKGVGKLAPKLATSLFRKGEKYALTKAGIVEFTRRTADEVTELSLRFEKAGKKLPTVGLQKVAEKRAARKWLKDLPEFEKLVDEAKDQLPFFDLGGIKWGVPFGPKTQLVKGSDIANFAEMTKLAPAARALKDYYQTTKISSSFRFLRKKLGKRFAHLPVEQQEVLQRGVMAGEHFQSEQLMIVEDILKGVSKKERKKIGFMIEDLSRGVPLPDTATGKVAGELKELFNRLGRTEQDFEILGREQFIDNYFPHLFKPSAAVEAQVGKRAVPLYTGSRFSEHRVFGSLDDAISKGLKPELDALTVAKSRVGAHARAITNAKLKRELTIRFGEEVAGNAVKGMSFANLLSSGTGFGAGRLKFNARGQTELQRRVVTEQELATQKLVRDGVLKPVPKKADVAFRQKELITDTILKNPKMTIEDKGVALRHLLGNKGAKKGFKEFNKRVTDEARKLGDDLYDSARSALDEDPTWNRMRKTKGGGGIDWSDAQGRVPKFSELDNGLQKAVGLTDARGKTRIDPRVGHTKGGLSIDAANDVWREMTGREPSGNMDEFLQWVRDQLDSEISIKNKGKKGFFGDAFDGILRQGGEEGEIRFAALEFASKLKKQPKAADLAEGVGDLIKAERKLIRERMGWKPGVKAGTIPKVKWASGAKQEFQQKAARTWAADMGVINKRGEFGAWTTKDIPKAQRAFFKADGSLNLANPKLLPDLKEVLEELVKPMVGWRPIHGITSKIIKPLLTTFFPSFHFRNFISGIFMGLTDPHTGIKAIPGLGAWKQSSEVMNIWKGLARGDIEEIGGKLFRTIGPGGKKLAKPVAVVDFTIDVGKGLKMKASELADEANRVGLFGRHQIAQETEALGFIKIPEAIKRAGGYVPFTREFASNMEDLMRLNAYTANRAAGLSARQAAENVGRFFIDYTAATNMEVFLRDIIPFYKFSREAIPTYGKELIKRPGMARPLALGYGQYPGLPEALPPYLEESGVIPYGTSERGLPKVAYLQSALPWETLQIFGTGRGFARTIEKNFIGVLNPLLKWAYALPSGREAFFGRPLYQNTRAPSWAVRMGLSLHVKDKDGIERDVWDGRLNAFLGMTPLSRLFNTMDKLLDPKSNWGETAVNTLTGVRVREIDVPREKMKKIRTAIFDALNTQADPEIKKGLYRLLYAVTKRKTPLKTTAGEELTKDQTFDLLFKPGARR